MEETLLNASGYLSRKFSEKILFTSLLILFDHWIVGDTLMWYYEGHATFQIGLKITQPFQRLWKGLEVGLGIRTWESLNDYHDCCVTAGLREVCSELKGYVRSGLLRCE